MTCNGIKNKIAQSINAKLNVVYTCRLVMQETVTIRCFREKYFHLIFFLLGTEILHLEPKKSDSINTLFFLELDRIPYDGFIIKNVCCHCNISLSSGQVKASGEEWSGIV